MCNNLVSEIIKTYDETAKKAYSEYIQTLKNAGRTSGGLMNTTAMVNGLMKKEIQSAAGKLGAILGAAGKRASRKMLFAALENARDGGADVTPTVAIHAAERVIGRGVSMLEANKVFGQSGRTAANKSTINKCDLVELENQVQREINMLKERLINVRHEHRVSWQKSSTRHTLLNDWRTALGGKAMGRLENV